MTVISRHKIRRINIIVLVPVIIAGSEDTAYSEDDQQQNRQRLIDCFPQAQWAKEVDVSDKEARCGVRCATRDHLPMVGNVPDYEATLVEYASLAEQKDEAVSAPVFDDLFMFAALGSRGLCSAPLCAEILAAQMSDEPDSDGCQYAGGVKPESVMGAEIVEGVKRLRRGNLLSQCFAGCGVNALSDLRVTCRPDKTR